MAEGNIYLLKCIECGEVFFTEGERDFYNSKGLKMPKRCKACRDRKKKRYEQEQKEKEVEEILLTLPFKQIEKTDIAFIDPNKVLFIIGNGFDLML